jgi:hypothetical protein
MSSVINFQCNSNIPPFTFTPRVLTPNFFLSFFSFNHNNDVESSFSSSSSSIDLSFQLSYFLYLPSIFLRGNLDFQNSIIKMFIVINRMKLFSDSSKELINIQVLKFILSRKYEVDEDNLSEVEIKEKEQKRVKKIDGEEKIHNFDKIALPIIEIVNKYSCALKSYKEKESTEDKKVLMIFCSKDFFFSL